MKHFPLLLALGFFLLSSCGDPIKNTDAVVEVEAGTDTAAHIAPVHSASTVTTAAPSPSVPDENSEYLGTWVGYFRKATQEDFTEYDDRSLVIDEGYVWNRENKINISIDQIIGDSVIGHSVVAGNDRPFHGRMMRDPDGALVGFHLREPGDDKYDGVFDFSIEDELLSGSWEAYGELNVKYRRYQLERKTFVYDPEQDLERAKVFVDWTKSTEKKVRMDYGDGEFEEWMRQEYVSATDAIYEVNASSQRLTKAEVENLKKGDLTIIRNTIYARHGYSFKNRPLRVFFDAQEWYIPVHTDIRADFTDLEKENIKLLLTYEKNAAEYYDSFGRG
jgi:hypothetical protein